MPQRIGYCDPVCGVDAGELAESCLGSKSKAQCPPESTRGDTPFGLIVTNEILPAALHSRTFFGTSKLPRRYAGLVLPLLLSILMTLVVSAVATLRSIGLTPDFVATWLSAWGLSWLIAFPTLLLALPLVRRITDALVEKE